MTEEAEEDLANNNDPNNNAEEFEDNALNQRPETDFLDEEDEDETEPFPRLRSPSSDIDFDDDVRTIQKVLPHKSVQQIRNHLEAYLEHPKRLKVISCLLTLSSCHLFFFYIHLECI